MAQKTDIRLRRSDTAGKIPTSANLSDGELAINTGSGALYFKKSDGTIITAHDNTILHIDSDTTVSNTTGTNPKVGIGTTSPSHKLDIAAGDIGLDSGRTLYLGSDSNVSINSTSSSRVMRFYTGGSERARIDSSGNVGIGTDSPSSILHVSSDSTPTIKVTDTTNDVTGTFYANNFDSYLSSTSRLIFQTGGSIAATISTSQNFGIGTTTPSAKLQVFTDTGRDFKVDQSVANRTILSNSYRMVVKAGSGYDLDLDTGSANGKITFQNNGSEVARFDNNGRLGIGTTSPSFPLHVATDGNTIAKYETSLTSDLAIQLSNSQGSMFFGLGGGEEFAVATDGDLNGSNNLFVIKQDGKVGIGDTTPTEQLTIKKQVGNDDGATALLGVYAQGGNAGEDAEIYIGHSTSRAAKIVAHKKGTGNDHDLSFSTNASASAPTEKMRILANGDVGIGTTAPSEKLTIDAGNIALDDNRYITWGSNTGRVKISGNESSDDIRFNTDNSERMRLTNTGLGIGITTTGTLHGASYGTTKLHVDGGTDRGQMILEGDTLASIVMSDNGATANSRVFLTQVNDGLMHFKSVNDDGTSKATIMSMTSAGNVGIGTTSPSVDLHIKPVTGNGNLYVERTSGALVFLQAQASAGAIGVGSNHRLDLKTNGTTRLSIAAGGAITFNTAFTFPTTDGTSGQVLKTNGSGTITWADETGGGGSSTSITDADLDTKIQVEESADEDIIRFDIAGTEKMVLSSTGLGIQTAGAPTFGQLEVYQNGGTAAAVVHEDAGTGTARFHIRRGTADTYLQNNSNGFEIRTESNISTSDNPAVKIANNGNSSFFYNVGIGTTNPGSLLSLEKGTRTLDVKLETTPASGDVGVQFRAGASDYLGLAAGGSGTGIIIDDSNNVGIGTTSPNNALDVVGNISLTGNVNVPTGKGLKSSGEFLNLESTRYLRYKKTGDSHAMLSIDGTNDTVTFSTTGSSDVVIDNSGDTTFSNNVIVTGNLTVDGTTTTLNTATLDVEDKNITLNYSTGDSSASADGAGITIQDAVDASTDASLTWNATDDNFEISHGLDFGDNSKVRFGASNDLQIYHDGSNSYVRESGTGELRVQGTNLRLMSTSEENYLTALENAGVRLWYDNNIKLTTTSSGIDVTGTVTSDGLTVDGNAALNPTSNFVTIKGGTNDNDYSGIIIQSNWANTSDGKNAGQIKFQADDDDITGSTYTTFATINAETTSWTADSNIGGHITIQTSEANSLKNRLRVSNNGDISFYEDTGTTAKFFWDASTERLGIGATSLTHTIHVVGSHNEMALFKRSVAGNSEVKIDTTTSGDAKLTFANNGTSAYTIGRDNSDGSFRIASGGTIGVNDRLVINSSGNVGIGTTSPSKTLDVNGSMKAFAFEASGSGNKVITIGSSNDGTYYNGLIVWNQYNTSQPAHRLTASSGGGSHYEYGRGKLSFIENQGSDITRMVIKQGNVGIGNDSPVAKLQVEEYGIDTTETSTTATTQVAIHTFAATDFRSARFTIQASNSTDSTYHISEILLVHDGTTPTITEYGTVFTGSAAEATFDADIDSGNVRLLATPASTDSIEFKVICHSVTV